MSFAVIIGILIFIAGAWVFLLMARRAVGLMIRLLLAGVVILALVIGSLVWWWYGQSSLTSPKENRPATTRRTGAR